MTTKNVPLEPSGGEAFAWCYTVGKKREVHFRRFEDDELVDGCTVTPLYTSPRVVGDTARLAEIIQDNTGCADTDSVYAAIALQAALEGK